MKARRAKKSAGKLTFDEYISKAVRAALIRSNTETVAQLEAQRKWSSDYHRERAVEARDRAKTTPSRSWATRWLNIAKEERARAREKPNSLPQRFSWSKYAGQALVYPEVHNSNVSDCIHVRIFDSRGVPVVRMSLTGTAQFIEAVVRIVSQEVSDRDHSGSLDRPDVQVWDETDGLPVAARLG